MGKDTGRQRLINLYREDTEGLTRIREAYGLRTESDAFRFAIRQSARLLDASASVTMPPETLAPAIAALIASTPPEDVSRVIEAVPEGKRAEVLLALLLTVITKAEGTKGAETGAETKGARARAGYVQTSIAI